MPPMCWSGERAMCPNMAFPRFRKPGQIADRFRSAVALPPVHAKSFVIFRSSH